MIQYRRTVLQLLLLSFLFVFSGCDDYRMNNMVDDQVYLLKPGLNETEAFRWGDFDYKLIVIKSGKGQQGASLEIVIDESVLTDYNTINGTAYKLLPEQCYKISSKDLSFSKDGYEEAFHFIFDTEAITQLQGLSNREYVIPARLNVKNNSIAAAEPERMSSIIAPSINEPYIEFSNPGMLLTPFNIAPDSQEDNKFSSSVKTNFNNVWDLTYSLRVEPELLENYNTENGTNYLLLPASAYKFDETSWKLGVKENAANFNFIISREALIDNNGKYLFGEYVIPVRLATASLHGINPEKSAQLLPVSFQPKALDRTDWEVIECSSERVDDGGGRDAVLDGNLDTYWHSMWEPDATLPHHLVIDMKKEYEVMSLELIRRMNNSNTKLVSFELSLDGETFEKVCEMDFGDANQTYSGKNVVITAKKARFVKCIVHESNNPPHASIAEIYVSGL